MLAHDKIVALIPTRDAVASRTFYETTLGLTFIKDDGFALIFDANGIMLRITKAPEFQPHPFTTLGWQVEDIRSKAASLTENGVAFERYGFFVQDDLGIWTAPDGSKVAWFKDPDGNLLSLSQHAA